MAAPSINTVAYKELNITCYAGDTFQASLTFTNENGDPIDLTTVVLKMQVRQMFRSATVLLSFLETDNSITKNINVVTIKKAIAIKGGDYVYDLQATDSSGIILTYLRGAFKVTQDVTDAK